MAGFEDEDDDEDSLPDEALRLALPPAQSRPRKRGTLHKKNVGGVGRTKGLVSTLQPATRVQFRQAQYSVTPTPLFEHEDEHSLSAVAIAL